MSRIFFKLKAIPPHKDSGVRLLQKVATVLNYKGTNLFVFLILGIAILLAVVFILEIYLFSASTVRNNILFSMDRNIQVEQHDILILNKRFNAVQAEFNDLKESTQSNFDKNATNIDRMEAILQSNIDELNDKFNNLKNPK